MTNNTAPSEIVEASGHLIDSKLLNTIFDKVVERRSSFEVLQFKIGRTNEEFSHLKLQITAPTRTVLEQLIEELMPLGCHPTPDQDAELQQAKDDKVAPDHFYSTTNHRTLIRHGGKWLEVNNQRMDAVIVVSNEKPRCFKLREVRQGDLVVCGLTGIRVSPEFRERDRHGFAFMSNDVSTERRVEVSVSKVIAMMKEVKKESGRIAFVAGPVIVHSGGVDYLSNLIRSGYVDTLLAGNALAVHDVEYALFGTSLGIDLEAGNATEEGHQNHMRAINTINRNGGLKQAVERGIVCSGIMYELITRGVKFVLAGSIRDDGPIPDTLMDLIEAQDKYAEALKDIKMVVMLSTMLHSIGVGNMLPSHVKVVCVDINPAVVTKLSDRGSSQTVGIVTDVGLFLHQLSTQLGLNKTNDEQTVQHLHVSNKKTAL